jgi:hypothetical protein
MLKTRLALALTAVNLGVPAALLMRSARPDPIPPVLRTRSLEIVDDLGRVRALLCIQPPTRADGKDYPETVLLRLIDPESGPVVKLTAARNGSALSLSDDADGGVLLYARDTGNTIRYRDRDGRETPLKP